MRIAIAVWGDRISPVFDVAREVLLFDLDSGSIQNETSIVLNTGSLSERAVSLRRNGVEKVICGAISESFYQLLDNQNIVVLPWLTGNISDILEALVLGRIEQSCFRMPGCHRHMGRNRYRGKRKSR